MAAQIFGSANRSKALTVSASSPAARMSPTNRPITDARRTRKTHQIAKPKPEVSLFSNHPRDRNKFRRDFAFHGRDTKLCSAPAAAVVVIAMIRSIE